MTPTRALGAWLEARDAPSATSPLTLSRIGVQRVVVARQPIATMRWEWELPGDEIAPFLRGVDRGDYRTVQRRDVGEFVLLGWVRG